MILPIQDQHLFCTWLQCKGQLILFSRFERGPLSKSCWWVESTMKYRNINKLSARIKVRLYFNTMCLSFSVLHTWNYYLFIISLFALAACILYSLQPESPKFLVTQNRFDEARETLKKIYTMNTGKPIETFSVRFI